MRRSASSSKEVRTIAAAQPQDPSRRKLLTGAAVAASMYALGCADRLTGALRVPETQRALDLALDGGPQQSGIEHIIVVMMENRSFDHMLGWAPGADGTQEGLWFTDNNGVRHRTTALAPDFQGCGHPDPDHSFKGGRIQFNDGACDGFLRSGNNDEFAIGYYRRPDLDFFDKAVDDWTIADRYFCGILGPTFPNRFHQHSSQTDRISNTGVISKLPTIWDRVADAGLTGKYYFSDLPFIGLWGAKYLPISHTADEFFADCAAGTLPNVAFLDPKFSGEGTGTSNDDHPKADVRAGQHFMHSIYTAVTNSPAWERTVLVFNYDEWGGFFDHVPPPILPVGDADIAAGNTDGRLGFRTPLIVVSPFARKHYVAHEVYNHSSILKMIEWRWSLPALSVRDASSNNLANVLDFTQAPRAARQYPVPPIASGEACAVVVPPTDESIVRRGVAFNSSPTDVATLPQVAPPWEALREVARKHGWDAIAKL
jgi:phospholipase C